MSPLERPIVWRSTRSTPRRLQRVDTTTESRGSARNTITIITAPSYLIPTVTISRPCPTLPWHELADQLRPAEDPGLHAQGRAGQFVEKMSGVRADAVPSRAGCPFRGVSPLRASFPHRQPGAVQDAVR